MPIESDSPQSSMIAERRYDADNRVLTVIMKSGRSYETRDVSPEVWDEFKNAASPGRWYRINIMQKDR